MNFKTTLLLIALLAIGGVVVFLTRDKSTGDESANTTVVAAANGAKILNVDSAAITALRITPADDKSIAVKRDGLVWSLEEPVHAPADPALLNRTIDALVNLKSKGTLPAAANESSTGLDHPKFQIEVTTKDSNVLKIDVGDRAATGNNLYVQKKGASEIDLVDPDILEDLESSPTAFRRAKIFDDAPTSIRQLTITPSTEPSPGTAAIVLERPANDWQIVEPTKLPAENSAVSDLLFALVGTKAEEFLAEKVDDPQRRGLDHPQLTVTFSTSVPTTLPASQPTSQPSHTESSIKFGSFTDITHKFVFATASNSPALLKVAATTIDSLKKSTIDLHDKRVLTIQPTSVSKIGITIESPATTQPTTREASKNVLEIRRAPKLPTSQPTSAPASQPTTQPVTQPTSQPGTVPAPVWEIVRTISEPTPAVEATVDSLLTILNPLRVEKYLATPLPATEPTTRAFTKKIVIQIETVAEGGTSDVRTITLTDPGEGKPIEGTDGQWTFEVNRRLLDAATADFSKPPAPSMTGGGIPANVNPE